MTYPQDCPSVDAFRRKGGLCYRLVSLQLDLHWVRRRRFPALDCRSIVKRFDTARSLALAVDFSEHVSCALAESAPAGGPAEAICLRHACWMSHWNLAGWTCRQKAAASDMRVGWCRLGEAPSPLLISLNAISITDFCDGFDRMIVSLPLRFVLQ